MDNPTTPSRISPSAQKDQSYNPNDPLGTSTPTGSGVVHKHPTSGKLRMVIDWPGEGECVIGRLVVSSGQVLAAPMCPRV
jgi:hypothetical protein